MDWFLYDNGLRHERVKLLMKNVKFCEQHKVHIKEAPNWASDKNDSWNKKINDTDWIVKNNLSSWKKLTIVCKKITRTGFLQATRTAYGTDRVKLSKASK